MRKDITFSDLLCLVKFKWRLIRRFWHRWSSDSILYYDRKFSWNLYTILFFFTSHAMIWPYQSAGELKKYLIHIWYNAVGLMFLYLIKKKKRKSKEKKNGVFRDLVASLVSIALNEIDAIDNRILIILLFIVYNYSTSKQIWIAKCIL